MAWVSDLESLKAGPCIIYQCIYGSRAFGLATESSDTDIRGVFILPKEQFYRLARIEQISDERSNELYWELGRFVELLLKTNPNALETLAVGERFVTHREALFSLLSLDIFLSQQACETFIRYASTQLKKARGLNRKIMQPMPHEKPGIFDFCFVIEGYGSQPLSEWLRARTIQPEECGLVRIPHTHDLYALFIGETGEFGGILQGIGAEDLRTSSVPAGISPVALLTFSRDAFRRASKLYDEYWDWVRNRNEERYRQTVEAAQGFDTKNMMHVFRLIGMAEDIVRHKQIVTERPEREELLKIKRGEYTADELFKQAEERLRRVEEELPKVDLRPEPDHDRALEVLYRIRDEFYRG